MIVVFKLLESAYLCHYKQHRCGQFSTHRCPVCHFEQCHCDVVDSAVSRRQENSTTDVVDGTTSHQQDNSATVML